MTEVDEIVAELSAPVSCWMNYIQQLRFQRLVQIARSTELALGHLDSCLERCERTDKVLMKYMGAEMRAINVTS